VNRIGRIEDRQRIAEGIRPVVELVESVVVDLRIDGQHLIADDAAVHGHDVRLSRNHRNALALRCDRYIARRAIKA